MILSAGPGAPNLSSSWPSDEVYIHWFIQSFILPVPLSCRGPCRVFTFPGGWAVDRISIVRSPKISNPAAKPLSNHIKETRKRLSPRGLQVGGHQGLES